MKFKMFSWEDYGNKIQDEINRWFSVEKPIVVSMTHSYSRGMGTTFAFLYKESVKKND